MTKPQVFVGTMYCGEGDYESCCDAIRKQSGVDVRHVIIANQPERQAHNELWNAWRAVQHSGFHLFVKVDADTVLAHDEVLLEFWRMVEANPRVTGIQAPLLDYFTDGFINGLNCFTPRVLFQDTRDELFCDRQVDVNHDVVVKADRVTERLRPAGYHCFKPNLAQAFHFGLHRALKNQTTTMELVKRAWQRHGDKFRAYAMLGAQCAPLFAKGGFNYTDDQFKTVLNGVDRRYEELLEEL